MNASSARWRHVAVLDDEEEGSALVGEHKQIAALLFGRISVEAS